LEFLSSVGGHIALAIERRRAEDALRKNEEMFRLLFSNNPLPTWVLDRETLRFLEVNDAAVEQYGYSREEFRNMSLLDVDHTEEKEKRVDHFRQWSGEGRYHGNWKHRKKDGKILEVETVSHELNHAGRRVRLVVAQDTSARHLLEQQFRQAQKMEAVGRLAGGVAHDFNNLLMVIKGHTELLRNSMSPTDQFSKKVEHIERAADRATSLTRQLLAFSRMQVLQPHVMNLNEVVEEGGRLLIETSNEELDSAYNAVHPVVRQGSYILLAVSDNGTGMDAETQAHIFEPFFTTKPQGKGTGLGLATVYGVVKQSGGFIWVYSELGKGTSFKIYLPRVDQAVAKSGAAHFATEVPRGTETILLAEDEQDVREVAREFLESGGYTVIEAHDGAEALRLVGTHEGAIELLITDMVMPGMSGQELAGRLQQKRAGLRTLYMSGYSERAAAESAQGDSSIRLLTKPFSRSALLRTVHEILKQA
jgi:PAS domain S-box-containing protein